MRTNEMLLHRLSEIAEQVAVIGAEVERMDGMIDPNEWDEAVAYWALDDAKTALRIASARLDSTVESAGKEVDALREEFEDAEHERSA